MSDEITPELAREQAAEGAGFLASIKIRAGDELFEIPQRGLMDDDARERLNELDLETESWDREDDVEIPERRLKDKDGNETAVFPAETRKGVFKIPHRKNGDLIKPSYPVRVAIAVLGEEKYARYKKAGGRATDVTATLARLDQRLKERESADPKSVGSDSAVETSPDAD